MIFERISSAVRFCFEVTACYAEIASGTIIAGLVSHTACCRDVHMKNPYPIKANTIIKLI
ncbi:protein of unknown function [Ruminococcaceae bacterium BL-6]|nr:protein of unknown function [Ruminococcaceae bacterium BL-6]